MKDIEIKRTFGIPIRTIHDWKNADELNWRKKVYDHLSNLENKQQKEIKNVNKS